MARQRPPTPEVRDFRVPPGASLRALLEGYRGMGGFSPKSLMDAVDVWRAMRNDGARIVLSIPAAPFATGLRGVVVQAVEAGLVHAVITTCGTLDHDLARTWGAYHQGSFQLDDADLHRRGVHRLGSVLVPRSSYGELLERRLQPLLEELFQVEKHVSTSDFCRFLGARLGREKTRDASLLYKAWRNKIPIFVPGPTDGAVGAQVWQRYQVDRSIGFDLLKDEQHLFELVQESKRLGGIIVGGGISKHHLIWWAQHRGGLDYAVAVTTAPEYDGSLSGARLREAISWGKIKAKARHATVDGDATLILPLLVAGVLEP